jgi:hypothetical protein
VVDRHLLARLRDGARGRLFSTSRSRRSAHRLAASIPRQSRGGIVDDRDQVGGHSHAARASVRAQLSVSAGWLADGPLDIPGAPGRRPCRVILVRLVGHEAQHLCGRKGRTRRSSLPLSKPCR